MQPMRIIAGDYANLADADVIVICAGIGQRPGQTRLELLKTNADILRQIIPKITAVNQDAIIVVATNPVDILTYISAQVDEIAISMPTIVRRKGVEEVLDLPLSETELKAFQASAPTLKERLSEL